MSLITQLSERLEAAPGVESVGMADSLPLLKKGRVYSILIEGKTDFAYVYSLTEIPKKGPKPSGLKPLPRAFFSEISPNYMRAMGIPLRQGREFDAHDNQQSSPVAIINDALARRHWPSENPIGKRFKNL